MNLSAPFIARPIGTTLLAIGLAFAGMVAFYLLPVAPLPQVDFPTIVVSGSLPGASAETMATSVAAPLESQLGRIAGVTEMTSASSLGSSRIILQFDLDRNIDGAARDVQAAINAARSNLPANLPTNPNYRKVNPADAPMMIIALTSAQYSPGKMYDVASTVLQQKISQIDGVGQVFVGGSSLPAVRVELNPNQLSHYQIGLPMVASAISDANINRAKGQLINNNRLTEITTNDQLFTAREYKPLIITYRNNQPVRLQDVGHVIDSVQDIRNIGLANGKPAVLLILTKQPGANIIQTIDTIHKLIPQLQATIPTGINMQVIMDRTTTIRGSLRDVEMTLCIAMVLVVLVSYAFLANFRAMIIPGVTVPLSMLGTFVIMYLLGYSLDNLSLMALTIATGFVVDDAVVVLENISRHLEAGMEPKQAALLGTQEVGFTVLSMSISLIAVFIPILLMGGIVGRLFREFSVTLSAAILVSLLISLTITPSMCARLLQKHTTTQPRGLLEYFGLPEFYARTLKKSLAYPRLMMLIFFLTVIATMGLFILVPKGFFPQQDTGRLTGSIQAQQNISFQGIRKILEQYVAIIKQDKSVKNVVGFVGGTTVNSGSIYITLKEANERDKAADEVITGLRKKLAQVKGANLYLQAAQDLLIGGRQGGAQFQYTLSADSLDELNHWTPIVQDRLARLPGIADVNSDQRSNGLQIMVKIDHDAALRYGITSAAIDSTLYNAFGQRLAATMYTNMNQYYVVMEVAPEYWQRPAILKQIFVLAPSGEAVPLSAFASFAPNSTLLQVNHQAQAPAATLSFNLAPKTALGDAVTTITQTVAKMNLPATMRGSFRGSAQAFQSSLANEPYLILAALISVYIVLGMLYESLIHPITILSTLPSAGLGALLALLLSGTDLSLIALIGIILLIGIVKKNAIMMVDFAMQAKQLRQLSSMDAIYEAALLRFRPIMMTTMAALFGAIPLIIGFETGAELRRPLGIAIIGGLIVSQMMTLYTTPIIYLALERFSTRYRKDELAHESL